MAKKKKSKLKKFGAALAAGLAGAALLGRNRDKGVMTADMDRSMVPMDNRMVQGLNFPAGTDLSGIDKIAAAGGVANLKKGGRVGCGKAKRGFGRALRKK